MLQRKIDANLLLASPLGLTVPVVLVLLAFVVARPRRMGVRGLEDAYRAEPTLRPALVACLITAVVGFAVNDSGIIVPAVALTLAVPLAVAASAAAATGRAGLPPYGLDRWIRHAKHPATKHRPAD